MAELSDTEKDAISHRGRAARALAAWLAEREAGPMSTTELSAEDRAGARDRKRSAQFSVIAACFLVALKLGTGLATGSLAFLAEAAHSATDLVAALLTLFAVRVALRPPDQEHNYGHGKAEHLAALGESAVLMLVALAIGAESVARLVERRRRRRRGDLVVVPRPGRHHRHRPQPAGRVPPDRAALRLAGAGRQRHPLRLRSRGLDRRPRRHDLRRRRRTGGRRHRGAPRRAARHRARAAACLAVGARC